MKRKIGKEDEAERESCRNVMKERKREKERQKGEEMKKKKCWIRPMRKKEHRKK